MRGNTCVFFSLKRKVKIMIFERHRQKSIMLVTLKNIFFICWVHQFSASPSEINKVNLLSQWGA